METTIRTKAALYSGTIPNRRRVDAGIRLRDRDRLAACQPTVKLLLLFHVEDEARLEGLQSGVRYADGTPKSSERPVAAAASKPRCGSG